MKLSKAFATILLIPSLLIIESAPTLASHTEVNGCGSGPTGRVTPNAPAGVSFEEACNNHDRCYGIIGKSQQDCDKAFHREMLDGCARKFKTIVARPLRAACNGAADVYYTAVMERGGAAYKAAQNHAHETAEKMVQEIHMAVIGSRGGPAYVATAKGMLTGGKTLQDVRIFLVNNFSEVPIQRIHNEVIGGNGGPAYVATAKKMLTDGKTLQDVREFLIRNFKK